MPLERHYTETECEWYERKARVLDKLYSMVETDATNKAICTGKRAGAALIKSAIDLLDAETIKKLEG